MTGKSSKVINPFLYPFPLRLKLNLAVAEPFAGTVTEAVEAWVLSNESFNTTFLASSFPALLIFTKRMLFCNSLINGVFSHAEST